eukprot:749145-Hanusia_phi.AAC.3
MAELFVAQGGNYLHGCQPIFRIFVSSILPPLRLKSWVFHFLRPTSPDSPASPVYTLDTLFVQFVKMSFSSCREFSFPFMGLDTANPEHAISQLFIINQIVHAFKIS